LRDFNASPRQRRRPEARDHSRADDLALQKLVEDDNLSMGEAGSWRMSV
jgi:hypothetical protein